MVPGGRERGRRPADGAEFGVRMGEETCWEEGEEEEEEGRAGAWICWRVVRFA